MFKQSHRILIGAFMLMAIVALAACGSDDPTAVPQPTSAPQPTASSSTGSTAPTTITATNPSTADLKGGSPEVFLKGFEDAIAGSEFWSTSEFAAAAKPLAAGEKLKIGFIFVGSQKDLGYNQAAAEAPGAQHPRSALGWSRENERRSSRGGPHGSCRRPFPRSSRSADPAA